MDTVETNVKELASNRWTNMFGLDEVSKHSFVEYLGKRLWQVRGELIDTAHSDRRLASDKYVKSMISESKYWETKDEIKCVYDAVVDNARVADDYAYKPLNEQILSDVNCEQVMFNTYKAPDTSETVPTDAELALWSRYWEHLLKDETERNRVQQWVASLAFQPEKRTGIAVLLHGLSTGTGKGTLGDIITALVGSSNAAKPMNAVQSLTGRFNAALEGKVLFIIDELYEGGNFKLANGIKGKITEPSLEVEPKNKELRKIDNYCNFFATSNHLTPLWLDDKDRRWEVYAVEYDEGAKEQHQKDVRAFRQWFDSDKVHATNVIRRLLKAVDISDYKPWAEGAMMTEAKLKLIASSTSNKEDDFELYWHEYKCDDDLMINASALFRKDWANVSSSQRTDILTKLGCQKLEKSGNVKVNGVQSRHWWVTPKGLSAGIETSMSGGVIMTLLEANRPDVTSASYDASSNTLRVNTQMAY
jgi:hypothetical protein